MRTSGYAAVLVGAFMCLAATAALAAEQPATGTPSATTPPEPGATQTAASPVDGAAETPPVAKEDEIVCKKEPPPVGSRLGAKKVCRTVAEWRRIESVARETTDEIQGRKLPEQSN